MKNPFETIAEPTLSNANQTVTYQELLALRKERLRVRIGSNAYRFQSFARIERWDGAQWHEVWHIGSGAMETREGLYVVRDVKASEFAADRLTLLDHALAVLT